MTTYRPLRAVDKSWGRFRFALVAFCLVLGLLGRVHAEAGPTSAWTQAAAQADARILHLRQMLRTGDAGRIQSAVLELQADPLAVNRLNRLGSDSLKTTCNEVLESIQKKTADQVAQTLAEKYGVSPEEVKVGTTTNPSTGKIKVGQDWDATVRVRGKDIPTKVASRALHDAYYTAATGQQPPAGEGLRAFQKAADGLAHKQCVEVTNYLHSEAYGGSQADAPTILQGAKDAKIRDPGQLSKVIEYKSNLAAERAATLEAQGQFVEAQGWRLEQCRQAVKQFDRQVLARTEALGGKVPEYIKKGMELMREVENGTKSPAEVEVLLRARGTSIAQLTRESADLVEAAHVLRPPGSGMSGAQAQEAIVQNVRNRIEIKRLAREAGNPEPEFTARDAERIRRQLQNRTPRGTGEPVGPEAPGVGGSKLKLVGKGLGFLMGLIACKQSYDVGSAAGDAIDRYANAENEQEAKQALDDLEDAAEEGTVLFGLTFLAQRHPVTAAGTISYAVTRGVMEYTGADETVAGFEDLLGQRMSNFWDDVGGVFGCETRFDRERQVQLRRVDAYRRALEEGRLKMREGMPPDMLLFFVYTSDSTDPEFRRLVELLAEKPTAESSQTDLGLAQRLSDPDLTEAQRRALLAELKRRGLWPPDTSQEEAGEPQVAAALAAVRGAYAALESAAQSILDTPTQPSVQAAANACQRFGEMYQQFGEQVTPVETETEAAVELIASAGRLPAAEKQLNDAHSAVMRAADAWRQARKTHDEILSLYVTYQDVRTETERCVDVARECGGLEQALYTVCGEQLGALAAMADQGATSAAVEIHLLRAKADDLRGQITDAISRLYDVLQPCEESEPPVLDIVQETRERMLEADAGFNAVQFVLGSQLIKRAEELEETRRTLDKRAGQRADRAERMAYLDGHLTKRQALLNNPALKTTERRKLQGEAATIAKDLEQNRQVAQAIDEDIEKREQDVKELEPTIKRLGDIATKIPLAE